MSSVLSPSLDKVAEARLCSSPDVCRIIGCDKVTVNRYRRLGILPALTVGTYFLYAEEDVLRLRDELRQGVHDGRRKRAVTA